LLSKIPVDQWFGKSVEIACGPMAGKVGQVERWGNGWITVRIPGVGTHNRRSFELFMVSKEEEEEEEYEQQEPSSLLIRSTVSPSPSSECGSTNKCPIVNKVSYSYDCEETPRYHEPPPPMPAVVIETPQTTERAVVAVSSQLSETPVASKADFGLCLKDGDREAHKITPLSPKKARMELPLAESLILAQEGGAKKYRIDMLFGTAALERSRRSIHKPSRYEDLPSVKK
jgi:hypothetical protein